MQGSGTAPTRETAAGADPSEILGAGPGSARTWAGARGGVTATRKRIDVTASTSDKPSVLFVCVHNAGRSQMAAGWLRHLAGDAVEVRSAGSAPAETINPAAVQAMREVGIDITDQTPQKLDPAMVEVSDVVVSMGCGDACPFFPGKRYEDWELEDPAGKGVDAVRPIRDEIRARVERLLTDLRGTR
jgi:arsenate reductase (thioredoxin)